MTEVVAFTYGRRLARLSDSGELVRPSQVGAMGNPHNPRKATTFALVYLSGGRCYWPTPPCKEAVTIFVDHEPVTNLEIAHIRAAEPGGPRYDPGMTDEQRRAWSNLILLCTAHHRVIDKVRPDRYTVDILERWKGEREAGAPSRLDDREEITEDRLDQMIRRALREAINDARAGMAPPDRQTAEILERAALQINPTVAETLDLASGSLRYAMDPDNVDKVWSAAQILQDTNIRQDIEALSDVVSQLRAAIDELRAFGGFG